MSLAALTMPGARCLLARELGRIARARWFYFTRTAALILTLVAMLFPFAFAVGPGSASSFEMRAMVGGWVFATVHAVALVISTFMVPAICAGAIAGERQQGTAEVLHTTPLSAFELVVGLAGGRLLALFVLALALAPAFAVCVAIGGVTADMMLRSLAAQLTYIVWLAALCTAISSRSPNAVTATRRSFGLVVAFAIGLPMLASFLGMLIALYGGGLPAYLASRWLEWVDPVPGCFAGFAATTGDDPVQTVITAGWQTALGLLVATRSIRRNLVVAAPTPARGAARLPAAGADDASLGRVVVTAGDHFPRGNPILWRERIERSGSRRRRQALLVGTATFIVLLVVAVMSSPSRGVRDPDVLLVASPLLLMLACIRLSSRVAPALSAEVLASRLEPLLVTSLDRRLIVRGHVLAGLRRALPPVALIGALTITLAIGSGWEDGLAMLWGALCGVVGGLAATLAVAAQISARRMAPLAATIRALAILFLLAVGYPFVIQVLTLSSRSPVANELIFLHPFTSFFLHETQRFSPLVVSAATASASLLAVLAVASVWFAERRFAAAPPEKWLGAAT